MNNVVHFRQKFIRLNFVNMSQLGVITLLQNVMNELKASNKDKNFSNNAIMVKKKIYIPSNKMK